MCIFYSHCIRETMNTPETEMMVFIHLSNFNNLERSPSPVKILAITVSWLTQLPCWSSKVGPSIEEPKKSSGWANSLDYRRA